MKTIKQIHTLLAGALLIAGTALWSGCSSNELLDSTTSDGTTAEQAGGISFTLKNPGARTRASQDATSVENEVKTIYAAFFIKNENEQESAYKLHRIFYYDTESSITSAWGENTKMDYVETDGVKSYTVTADNMKNNSTYTGTYIVYFIANPEAAIKTQLKKYQDTGTDARTTLGAFEKDLVAKEAAYDATTTAARGFTMLNKSTIEVAESPKSCEVMLTRLAARFDFVNSSPDNATITSVKFNNLAKQSDLVQKSVNTPEGYFYTSTAPELTKTWPTEGANPAASMTVYAYENLNTNTGGNMLYSSIDVTYTLGGGAAKTLRIELKEKEASLALMRNHLYKINLNCIAGTYDQTVQEWTGGETVTIPNDKLAIVYTADSLGKVGDYVYNNNGELAFSDGGLRKMYLDGTLEWATRPDSKTDKGTCIGIVFSNNTTEEDKAFGFKKGYIISIKDASKGVWKNEDTSDNLGHTIKTMGDFIQDMNGLTYCRKIKAADPGFANHPVLYKLETEYSLTAPTSGTSEWFIPSTGQWCCAMTNLSGVSVFKNNINNATTYPPDSEYKWISRITDSESCLNPINAIMQKVNGDTYKIDGSCVMCSSESYQGRMAHVQWGNNYNLTFGFNIKKNAEGGHFPRPFLAF